MFKTTVKISVVTLLMAAVAGAPLQLNAQTSEKPAAEKKEKAKPAVTPFHGKLKAIDKTAKTITVGEHTIQITSETKITKDGKPATLDEGVTDEMVAGAYKKADDGTLHATSIRFGAKAEEPKKEKKKQ